MGQTTPWINACSRCGAHGHFVIKDSRSAEFASKEGARRILKELIVSGAILAGYEDKLLMALDLCGHIATSRWAGDDAILQPIIDFCEAVKRAKKAA